MNDMELAQAFHAENFELYAVGGSVRDELMGIENHDRDFCTNAHPDQTYKILSQFGRPYKIGIKFGTVGLGDVEITTYRTETYTKGSRKPQVSFGTSLIDDLSRRDFTINAMARNVLTGEIIDPFNGQDDIRTKTIRAVGNAVDRFGEDPLRLLRAIRFACRFQYQIDIETLKAMRTKVRSILSISQDRIRDEMTYIVTGNDIKRAFTILSGTGLLSYIAPEMTMLNDPRSQGYYHNKNVWGHTLDVAANVPNRLVVRWAALLHDIGKMATRTEVGGTVHYYGHEDIGAILALSILRRLRYDNDTIGKVTKLIQYHMQVNYYKDDWNDASVRRLLLRLGDDVQDAIDLSKADQSAHKRKNGINNGLEERISNLDKGDIAVKLPIDGRDLMVRYKKGPGRWIADIKAELTEQIINGTLSSDDKETAFDIADRLVAVP